jgi:hypothetical protein
MITRTHAQAVWMTQEMPRASDRKARAAPRRGAPATLISEADALECRARHEFHAWSLAHCASHYGLSLAYVRRFLNYEVRSNLVAEPRHANLGTEVAA